MSHPPASQERLSHWNNSPTSSALITCMAGSPLADWQGRGASGANALETGIVPDPTGNGGTYSPAQSCSTLPISTGSLSSQPPSDIGSSSVPLVQMGNGGRERALTLLSWNEASALLPQVLEQHLFAPKFCSKKETTC